MKRISKKDLDIDALGPEYHQDKTIFRVFVPDCEMVFLSLKDQKYPMHKDGCVFHYELEGDREGLAYRYLDEKGNYFRDPFSYLCDQEYSYVLNS